MQKEDVTKYMFHQRGTLALDRGEGCWLFDTQDRKYLDASGGPMAMTIGYGRTEPADAASDQIKKLAYTLPVYAHESRLELSKRIQALTPGDLNRIWFGSGGSEANEAALKFAIQAQQQLGRPGKHKIISRRVSYHGSTLFTLSVGGLEARKDAFRKVLFPIEQAAECHCYRCPFDTAYPDCALACADDLEAKILEAGPDTVAAFIAEPVVAAAAGVVAPPSPEYFQRIRRICDKYDVLWIADEVVTGFGRTGLPFAVQHSDVVPDILVFGKGVASAYAPLAGFAARDGLVKAFDDAGVEFNTIFTYSAHPLSCAIGVSVQDIIRTEGLFERAATTGQYLGEQLKRLEDIPIVGDVRGLGMLWGIEIVKDRDTKTPFPADMRVKEDILRELYRRGVLCYVGYWTDPSGAGAQIILAPPFVITPEEVDWLVGVVDETLRDRAKAYRS